MRRRTCARVQSPVTLLLLAGWMPICDPATASGQDTLTGVATVDVGGREMAGDYAGTDACYGSRDQGTFSLNRVQ